MSTCRCTCQCEQCAPRQAPLVCRCVGRWAKDIFGVCARCGLPARGTRLYEEVVADATKRSTA